MKSRIKLIILFALSAISVLVANTSSNACWLWSMHQKECPEALIK